MTSKSVVKSKVTKKISIRFDDSLFKKIEAEVQRTGKSISEVIHLLVEQGFKYSDKAEDFPEMRLILLKYHAKCLKCGCDLPPQTWAMYGKGVGAVCIDCFIEKLGDKAMVKKIMRLKELKWSIKALERQVELKSNELRKLEFLEIINDMWKGYGEIHKLVLEYLKTGFNKPDKETKALDELERLIEKQWAIIEEARLFLMGPMPVIKKKKKKKVPYAT